MTDRRLLSSLAASSLIHLALIPIATLLTQPKPIRLTPVPIEIVDVPPVEQTEKVEAAPPPPSPLPKTNPVRKAPKISVPKLLSNPEIIAPKPQPPAGITKEEIPEPEKPGEEPPKLAGLPEPPGSVQGGRIIGDHSGEAEGRAAGAGNLFEKGDVGAVGGSGAEGGGGGKGMSGLGSGTKGKETGGGVGFGEALSGLARPLGGYQVKPRYPEAARRAGAQGITILKVNVLENGRVGEVLIEKSAGFRELDVSAMEAVQKWLFEPARRGKDRVAVWVLLPVKFELR
jgi:periplasmic protein TonB